MQTTVTSTLGRRWRRSRLAAPHLWWLAVMLASCTGAGDAIAGVAPLGASSASFCTYTPDDWTARCASHAASFPEATRLCRALARETGLALRGHDVLIDFALRKDSGSDFDVQFPHRPGDRRAERIVDVSPVARALFEQFDDAVKAVRVFAHREAWEQLMRQGMREDHSWRISAREYVKVYKSASRRG